MERGGTRGLQEPPPGLKEVEAREAAEKRDSSEAEDRGTVPSPSPEGNIHPNIVFSPIAHPKSPPTPRTLLSLCPKATTAGRFKQRWTNSSIPQSWTVSERSVKHEQGSLWLRSPAAVLGDRQGWAGTLETTALRLLFLSARTTARVLRDKQRVITHCAMARATSRVSERPLPAGAVRAQPRHPQEQGPP